jgi:hypothetical protein
MAVTQLSDIYEPLTFRAGVDEIAIELNAFIASGIMAENPSITEQAMAGGRIGEIPFHKNLDTSAEPNYSSDDPSSSSTPNKITVGKMIWRLAAMNKSWSTMDLTRELALMDPLGAITSKIGAWWATQKEKRLIQSCVGLYNANVTDNSSDMIENIYSDITTPLAANIISGDAMLDARQTSGDHSQMYSACAMHSVTFNNLNKQNFIDYIPNSDGAIDFPRYLNMVVVIDDSLPVTAGTNSPAYLTILFQSGAFEHGIGRVDNRSELWRDPASGTGGGQDVIFSRSSDIIHPYGYQFTGTTVVDESATLAELALTANWTRVTTDRKLVGIAFLKHNN